VPQSNPFVGDPNAEAAIYAYGLRNPWRFSFDKGAAHRLFSADVGQNLYEEVDIITSGGNYGWNIKEGTHCFDPQNPDTPPAQCPDTGKNREPLIDPVIEYNHNGKQGTITGSAVVGGYVYRGNSIPSLFGKYIFGDWSAGLSGQVFVAQEKADKTWRVNAAAIAGQPNGKLNRFVLAFGQDATGELYILTTANAGPSGKTGEVYKIVAPR
jgi:glucose/arabinose dehydrogenase